MSLFTDRELVPVTIWTVWWNGWSDEDPVQKACKRLSGPDCLPTYWIVRLTAPELVTW